MEIVNKLMDNSIQAAANFLLKYACAQLGAGGQTLRVSRTLDRLAGCFGYECHATFLSRHVIMTVTQADAAPVTLVGAVPNLSLNFRQLVALNTLSWQALDERLGWEEVAGRFEKIMSSRRYSPLVTQLGAAFANAAFCRLFGGDISAIVFVFIATFIAMLFRRKFDKHCAAPCFSFMLTAFVASMIVGLATIIWPTATPQVAIGSSVLFLIPGVPMINSSLDLLTGFPLMAFSRLVRSGMLVSSIGLGLGTTLFLTGLEMDAIIPVAVNDRLWLALALDGFFAAIASMGFALLSNPRLTVIIASGILAALAHAFRFFLLQATPLEIIPASLAAAFLIGIFCVFISKRMHVPGEFFSFLALLPMIPGMFAYGTILSTIHFMMAESVQDALPCLVVLIKDFLNVLFIMCAMSFGAIAPLLAQHFFIKVDYCGGKSPAPGRAR